MNTTLAFALLAAVAAQPAAPPPFIRDRVKSMMNYYQSPDPALGPTMLKELLKKENIESPWFSGKDHVLNIIGSQLGDIGKGQPKIVREYEATFADASPAGRRVILRALTNCGDKETAKQVDAWIADKRFADAVPDLEALKKRLADPNYKHVRDRPAKTPDDLDFLWANFFTTGEYQPVARILDVFDLPDAQDNAVLKRVARWSLGSNMQQHKKLAELVEKHAKERPAASRKVVEELLRPMP